MQEYQEIRETAEKDGFKVTDQKFGELIDYARRKAAVSGKNEDYLPLLLPDVIKEFCVRNAINAVSIAAMEIDRFINQKEVKEHGSGINTGMVG